MHVSLPYGKSFAEVSLPDNTVIAYPKQESGVLDVGAEIRRAMSQPIGVPRLCEIARGKPDAVIVINDLTRPAPNQELVESILEELNRAGIRDNAITVVIATGNHRPNTPDEIEQMLGRELCQRVRVVNHDWENQTNLTQVQAPDVSIPVWINSIVVNASLKILTGLITPHQSAGYSGGRKSLMPGVAGLESISKHHSFPIRPYAPSMGWMHGNPFHDVALQVAQSVGIDFIVNVIKNWRGQVTRAVAGDLVLAHEAGVSACEQSWLLTFPEHFDVVVVTPGGHPRDIDLYQAQKAVSAAELVARPNGAIVLIAECSEGVGKFAASFQNTKSPEEIIERFRREGYSRALPSKAFMWARAIAAHPIFVASSGIKPSELETLFLRDGVSPQDAIEKAIALCPGRVLVLPYAIDCVPQVNSDRRLSPPDVIEKVG